MVKNQLNCYYRVPRNGLNIDQKKLWQQHILTLLKKKKKWAWIIYFWAKVCNRRTKTTKCTFFFSFLLFFVIPLQVKRRFYLEHAISYSVLEWNRCKQTKKKKKKRKERKKRKTHSCYASVTTTGVSLSKKKSMNFDPRQPDLCSVEFSNTKSRQLFDTGWRCLHCDGAWTPTRQFSTTVTTEERG